MDIGTLAGQITLEDALTGVLMRLDSALKVTDDSSRLASIGIGRLESSMTAAAAVGSFMGNVLATAFSRIVGFTKDLVSGSLMAGARLEQLGVATRFLGEKAGYSGPQIDELARKIQKTGISGISTRESILQLLGANIDLANAAKLSAIAQNMQSLSGRSSSEVFQVMTRAIATGNTEILRNIGFQNLGIEAMTRASNAVTGHTGSVTGAARASMIMNAIMKEGAEKAGLYGESMKTAGKQASSAERAWAEVSEEIGGVLLPITSLAIKTWYALGGAVRDAVMSGGGSIKVFVQSAADGLSTVVTKVTELATQFKTAVTGMAPDIIKMIGDIQSHITSAWNWLSDFNERWQITNTLISVGKAAWATLQTAFYLVEYAVKAVIEAWKSMPEWLQKITKTALEGAVVIGIYSAALHAVAAPVMTLAAKFGQALTAATHYGESLYYLSHAYTQLADPVKHAGTRITEFVVKLQASTLGLQAAGIAARSTAAAKLFYGTTLHALGNTVPVLTARIWLMEASLAASSKTAGIATAAKLWFNTSLVTLGNTTPVLTVRIWLLEASIAAAALAARLGAVAMGVLGTAILALQYVLLPLVAAWTGWQIGSKLVEWAELDVVMGRDIARFGEWVTLLPKGTLAEYDAAQAAGVHAKALDGVADAAKRAAEEETKRRRDVLTGAYIANEVEKLRLDYASLSTEQLKNIDVMNRVGAAALALQEQGGRLHPELAAALAAYQKSLEITPRPTEDPGETVSKEYAKKVATLTASLRSGDESLKVFADSFKQLTPAMLASYEVQERLAPSIMKMVEAGKPLTVQMENALKNYQAERFVIQEREAALLNSQGITLQTIESYQRMGLSLDEIAQKYKVLPKSMEQYVAGLELIKSTNRSFEMSNVQTWSSFSEEIEKHTKRVADAIISNALLIKRVQDEASADMRQRTMSDANFQIDQLQRAATAAKAGLTGPNALAAQAAIDIDTARQVKQIIADDELSQKVGIANRTTEATLAIKELNKAAKEAAYDGLASFFTQLGQIAGEGGIGKFLTAAGNMVIGLQSANKWATMKGGISKETLGGNFGSLSVVFDKGADASQRFAAGLQSAAGIAQGAMNVWQATGQSASKMKNALSGAMAGAQAGAMFGPWGIAIGAAAGLVVGLVRGKPAWAKASEEIGRDFGKALSDAAGKEFKVSNELAKKIADAAKVDFKGDRATSITAHIGDLIKEAGGLTEKNVTAMTGKLRDVFVHLGRGAMSSAQAMKTLEENWMDFARAGTDATGALSTGLREILQLSIQNSVVTKSMTEYMKQQAGIAIGSSNVIIAASADLFKRAEGIGSRVTAAQDLVKAMRERQAALDAGLADDTAAQGSAASELFKKLDEAMTKAREAAGAGSDVTMDQAQAGLTSALESQFALVGLVKDELSDLGTIAFGAFAAAREAGASFNEALQAAQPGLQQLSKGYKDLGIDVEDAGLAALLMQSNLLDRMPQVMSGVSALGANFTALANIGMLNASTFGAMERTGARMYTRIQGEVAALGGTTRDALLPMQDYLHAAVAEAAKLGIPIDDATQSMIQQSQELKIWKDIGPSAQEKMIAVTDKLTSAIEKLTTALTGIPTSLPDPFANWSSPEMPTFTQSASAPDFQGITDGASAAADAVNELNFGTSPGGLKEIPILLDAATVAMDAFRFKAQTSLDVVKTSVDNLTAPEMPRWTIPEMPRIKLDAPSIETPEIADVDLHKQIQDMLRAEEIARISVPLEVDKEVWARSVEDITRQMARISLPKIRIQPEKAVESYIVEPRREVKDLSAVGNAGTVAFEGTKRAADGARIGIEQVEVGLMATEGRAAAAGAAGVIAFRSMQEAAYNAAVEVDRLNFGSSPGGLKEISLLLATGVSAAQTFKNVAVDAFGTAKSAADSLALPSMDIFLDAIARMGEAERSALEVGMEGFRGTAAQFLAQQAALYQHAQEGDARLRTWLSAQTLDTIKATEAGRQYLDVLVAQQQELARVQATTHTLSSVLDRMSFEGVTPSVEGADLSQGEQVGRVNELFIKYGYEAPSDAQLAEIAAKFKATAAAPTSANVDKFLAQMEASYIEGHRMIEGLTQEFGQMAPAIQTGSVAVAQLIDNLGQVKMAAREAFAPASTDVFTAAIAAMSDSERQALEAGHAEFTGSIEAFLSQQALLYTVAREGDVRLKTWLSGTTLDMLGAAAASDVFVKAITLMGEAERDALATGMEGFQGTVTEFLAQQAALYQHVAEGDSRLKTWLSGSTLETIQASEAGRQHIEVLVAQQKALEALGAAGLKKTLSEMSFKGMTPGVGPEATASEGIDKVNALLAKYGYGAANASQLEAISAKFKSTGAAFNTTNIDQFLSSLEASYVAGQRATTGIAAGFTQQVAPAIAAGTAAVSGFLYGTSPGGLKEIPILMEAARRAVGIFKVDAVSQFGEAQDAAKITVTTPDALQSTFTIDASAADVALGDIKSQVAELKPVVPIEADTSKWQSGIKDVERQMSSMTMTPDDIVMDVRPPEIGKIIGDTQAEMRDGVKNVLDPEALKHLQIQLEEALRAGEGIKIPVEAEELWRRDLRIQLDDVARLVGEGIKIPIDVEAIAPELRLPKLPRIELETAAIAPELMVPNLPRIEFDTAAIAPALALPTLPRIQFDVEAIAPGLAIPNLPRISFDVDALAPDLAIPPLPQIEFSVADIAPQIVMPELPVIEFNVAAVVPPTLDDIVAEVRPPDVGRIIEDIQAQMAGLRIESKELVDAPEISRIIEKIQADLDAVRMKEIVDPEALHRAATQLQEALHADEVQLSIAVDDTMLRDLQIQLEEARRADEGIKVPLEMDSAQWDASVADVTRQMQDLTTPIEISIAGNGDLPQLRTFASDADVALAAVNRLNFGSSPGGLKEIPLLLQAAVGETAIFAEKIGGVRGAVDEVNHHMGDFAGAARNATDAVALMPVHFVPVHDATDLAKEKMGLLALAGEDTGSRIAAGFLSAAEVLSRGSAAVEGIFAAAPIAAASVEGAATRMVTAFTLVLEIVTRLADAIRNVPGAPTIPGSPIAPGLPPSAPPPEIIFRPPMPEDRFRIGGSATSGPSTPAQVVKETEVHNHYHFRAMVATRDPDTGELLNFLTEELPREVEVNSRNYFGSKLASALRGHDPDIGTRGVG